MENLIIPPSKYTLEVNFDVESGIFDLKGSSYPEHAMEFFQPLYDWVHTYIKEVKDVIILNLKVNYLNTSSTKCILDLVEILNEYFTKGGNVKVNWFHEDDDEDMLELGQEIGEDLQLPLKIISYEEE